MKKTLIIFLCSFSIIFAKDNAPKIPYLNEFKETAIETNIPLSALIATAKLTTNFNKDFSVQKRCGLMSVESTLDIFSDDNVDCFDPQTNIRIAAKWLFYLREEKGNIKDALKYYLYSEPTGWEKESITAKEKKYYKEISELYLYYKIYFP